MFLQNIRLPLQFIWLMGGGSSAVKHNLTITLTNGVSKIVQVPEGSVRIITIQPNAGYLPPETLTFSPSTGFTSVYDKYTGKLTISGVVGDIAINGTCRAIPTTYAAIAAFPMTHEDIKKYGLTYKQLHGDFT